MDRDFECISDSLPDEVDLNTTSRNDYVPEIKWKNRIIKEREGALIITAPFKNISYQIIIELIRFLGLGINQEPLDNGVSYVYSPHNIITGQDIAHEKHWRFRFGYYVEDHEDLKITNKPYDQRVSDISLGPTANFQGSYKINSLKTGRVVTGKNKIWETPMSTWTIQHVDALTVRNIRDIANCYEPLSVDQFSNKNGFASALHEGGITGVAQDTNEQDDNND